MSLVNLTPHVVVVYGSDDQILVDIPSTVSLRLAETATEAPPIHGIPATTVTLGGADLPPVVPGTTYIVSMPLMMGLMAAGIDRPDMAYPYGQVRDPQGRIIGCRSLARLTAAR